MLFGNGVPEIAQLSTELATWVEEFKPDVIYSCLGSNGIIDLVSAIQFKYDLPLVVHFMDDWPSTLYKGGVFSILERERLRRNLKKTLSRANAKLAISDAMAAEYFRRYGHSFEPFHNPIDIKRWLRPDGKPTREGGDFRIVYAGSILPFAQDESLTMCCRAIAQLRHEGMPVKLDIYSANFQSAQLRERLLVSEAITLNDSIELQQEYFGNLTNSDALLLPVNFDRRSIEFIKYSIPAKVSDCLISGVPVFVYGPAGVAQVDYALAQGWAHVVTEQDQEIVALELRRLLLDSMLRENISKTALQVAIDRHDAHQVRASFEKTIRRCAGILWQET